MNKFVEIDKIGILNYEKIIFSASYPIIFTCRDNRDILYLAVCCQKNKVNTKWLLAEVDASIVIDMLSDKLTLREAFVKYNKTRISIIKKNNTIETYFDVDEDWNEDSIYLPDKGEYIDADDGEFDEEIEFYKDTEYIEYDLNLSLKIESCCDNIMTKSYSKKIEEYVLKVMIDIIEDDIKIDITRNNTNCVAA